MVNIQMNEYYNLGMCFELFMGYLTHSGHLLYCFYCLDWIAFDMVSLFVLILCFIS